ncbi:MAG: hypothetical protein KJ955_07420 [Nanoarchaeota archaeon]|nr:hypothetical protein [Nanoarchaeota archaeon]
MGKALIAAGIIAACILVLVFAGITGNFIAVPKAPVTEYTAVIKEIKPLTALPTVRELQPLPVIPPEEEIEEPLIVPEEEPAEPMPEEAIEDMIIDETEEETEEQAGEVALPDYSDENTLLMEAQYEKEDILKIRNEQAAIKTAIQIKPAVLEIRPGVISAVRNSFRRIWIDIAGTHPAYPVALSAEDTANPILALADIAKYQRFQRLRPAIFRQMIWVDEEHLTGESIIYSREKMEMLAHYLALLETGQQFPFEAPPEGFDVPWGARLDSTRKFYTEEEALSMWIPHLAVSLYTEVNELVPWSIVAYTNEQKAFLLDSRYFINYWDLPTGPAYTFFLNWENGGGLSGITDWNAFYSFEFLRSNDMARATQEESIYAFTQWIREGIFHEMAANAYINHMAYGYNGSYPVDKILNPPEGMKSWTQGCSGTSSLYSAVLKTINIPVSINMTIGGHRGPLFLTAGLALMHGDDPYGLSNRRGLQEVPVNEIFMTIAEFNAMNNAEPEPYYGYTPNRAEMALYLNSRRIYLNAYERMAYALLSKRAGDVIAYAPANITTSTLEHWWGYESWRPIFEADERRVMFENMDAEITRIGEGDYRQGWRNICSGLIPRPEFC